MSPVTPIGMPPVGPIGMPPEQPLGDGKWENVEKKALGSSVLYGVTKFIRHRV